MSRYCKFYGWFGGNGKRYVVTTKLKAAIKTFNTPVARINSPKSTLLIAIKMFKPAHLMIQTPVLIIDSVTLMIQTPVLIIDSITLMIQTPVLIIDSVTLMIQTPVLIVDSAKTILC